MKGESLSDYMMKRLKERVFPFTPVATSGDMVTVIHELGARNKVGDPETYSPASGDMFRMDRGGLEIYIRGLFHLMNPNMLPDEFERNWHSFWRDNCAFSNKHGWNSGNFRYQNLYIGGATFLETGRSSSRGFVEVWAFDPAHMPPPPTSLSQVDMRKHFFPVNSTDIKVDGSDMTRKDPFSQFNGRCPLPLIGVGGKTWIHSNNISVVTSMPNPFFPARPDVVAGLSGY